MVKRKKNINKMTSNGILLYSQISALSGHHQSSPPVSDVSGCREPQPEVVWGESINCGLQFAPIRERSVIPVEKGEERL